MSIIPYGGGLGGFGGLGGLGGFGGLGGYGGFGGCGCGGFSYPSISSFCWYPTSYLYCCPTPYYYPFYPFWC